MDKLFVKYGKHKEELESDMEKMATSINGLKTSFQFNMKRKPAIAQQNAHSTVFKRLQNKFRL